MKHMWRESSDKHLREHHNVVGLAALAYGLAQTDGRHAPVLQLRPMSSAVASPWVWCTAVILLSSSSCTYAFEAELCSGNCSYPAHICGLIPANSWLSEYVPSIMKVCRCENYTMAGRRCDTPCPHGHSNPCNGHGECLYDTATCACDFGWQGVKAKCTIVEMPRPCKASC